MNILLYENYVPPAGGGVERASFNLATVFGRHGIKVFVAHRVPVADDEMPSCYAGHILISPDSPADADRLAEYAREKNISIMIHQNAEILYRRRAFWSRLRRQLSIPMVACLHREPAFYRHGFRNKDWRHPGKALHALVQQLAFFFVKKDASICRFAYAMADKIVVLSPAYVKEWQEISRQKDEAGKITAIPNFIHEAECPSQTPSKEKLILFVGRMQEQEKRVSEILKIWKQLSMMFPEWKLCLLGDGPHLQCYRQMAQGLPRMEFTGQVNPDDYYRRASLIFLTSPSEGMPMVLLEGMLCGVVPLIYNSFASAADIISDACLLVPDGDRDAFVRKASGIINSPATLARLSESSRKRIADCYSEDIIWSKWEKLLQELLHE